MKIACLDFETANPSAVSICSAAVVVYENNEETLSKHWLVRPPNGHDWFRKEFIEIHGITPNQVKNAPEFSTISSELLSLLQSADYVVAHNASFDLRVLRGTLSHFKIPCPSFPTLCTCKIARKAWPNLFNHKLNTVAKHIGHTFRHHDALDDAKAAGKVLLCILHERGEEWVKSQASMSKKS